ncbi:hypothetical protein [Arthrobacter globiformis]|uniref:hypothetical protein n=1 Tax=Arthrobacter globiformis TaxID=1665 RepID=UPI0027D7DE3D|nr:hypothetical protein [Arthrobacter globiformis]
MNEDNSPHGGAAAARTGANDHSWEREHRHPTITQARGILQRRREAEAKLEQHQQEARRRAAG